MMPTRRRGPLTPRPGYRITITQRLGDRPILQVECLACPDFHEPLDHPALDVVDPELTGRAVLSGITRWLTHNGERHP